MNPWPDSPREQVWGLSENRTFTWIIPLSIESKWFPSVLELCAAEGKQVGLHFWELPFLHVSSLH